MPRSKCWEDNGHSAMSKKAHYGIISKADWSWKQRKPQGRFFGIAYLDTSPKPCPLFLATEEV
eukprot:10369591-Ditylum_brightwellii.AAC.1